MEIKGLIKKIKKEGDLKTYVVLTEKGSELYHKQVTERSIHLIFSKLSKKKKTIRFCSEKGPISHVTFWVKLPSTIYAG